MQSKPVTFETYGPFTLSREAGLVTRQSLASLWDGAAAIQSGIGVYLIGKRVGKKLIPWYVGKTDKGFKRRFEQHYREKKTFGKLGVSLPDGDLTIVFLARTTPGGQLKKGRKPGAITRSKAVKSIDRLEYELIHLCHKKNPKLINTSNRVFQEGFSVPGYRGPRQEEAAPPAQTLRDFLTI